MVRERTHHWRDVEAFTRACEDISSIDDLWKALDWIVRRIGFAWFALIDPSNPGFKTTGCMPLVSFPEAWREEYIREQFYRDDPARHASANCVLGICWHRVGETASLSRRQRHILQRARCHGLMSGFTMHVRMPGEPAAAFSVGRPSETPVTARESSAIRLTGLTIFEHARRLRSGPGTDRVALSRRQIDCIALVAQGKSDWEISRILGLSRDTVHEYIEAARRRCGVHRRTQLVLRAIHDGYLTYDTVL
ncbi:MAG: transcriptional regulator [Telmatospirillum sp.]|nr:transcriptional regulator [Telmatospirillum sp.]